MISRDLPMLELAPHHKRGLSLPFPIMNAAGILGWAGEQRGLIDFAALGALVTNPVTWTPRTPAHSPNVLEVPEGVLIHTGLPNPGVRRLVRQHAHDWARLGCPVIVHLAATSLSDVARAVEVLERAEAVSGIELGLRETVTASELSQLLRAVVGGPPLIVRLPLPRAVELGEIAARAGADALTIGAPTRLTVSVNEHKVTGRLYSPEAFPLALTTLQQVADLALGVPLIGAGGIFSNEQGQTMLDAGATAIQVDAVLWREPQFIQRWSVR
jgi:dihydroorotate dehydrogenase (NAD+) catalytic subunit